MTALSITMPEILGVVVMVFDWRTGAALDFLQRVQVMKVVATEAAFVVLNGVLTLWSIDRYRRLLKLWKCPIQGSPDHL
jgi:hypothetical protein